MIIRKPSHEQKMILFYSAYFFLCLFPIGIGSLSVNYLFLLMPLVFLMKNRLQKPPSIIVLSLFVFSGIFIISSFFQIDQHMLSLRRLSSFIIFITIFAYSFLSISDEMKKSFEIAIILSSLYFSIFSIISFLTVGTDDLSQIKNLIGSQRFGFVYLMAIAILTFRLFNDKGHHLGLFIAFLLIIAGLFLTLSRSSILSLILMSTLFISVRFFQTSTYKLKTIFISLFSLATASLIIIFLLPGVNKFFIDTLITPLLNAELISASANVESSEGIRLFRIKEVLEFVSLNPLLGSGFLGIWAISETGSGSAHNQLLDTLLRVGIFGFILYALIGILLLQYLNKNHKALFWGLVGVLIYGMFHETFKESQGAFILSFLIGAYSDHYRKIKKHSRKRIQDKK